MEVIYRMEIKEIQLKSQQIRNTTLQIISEAGSGHPGGSLSCIEILTTLYFRVMNQSPTSKDVGFHRDKFILSKGHATPSLYIVLKELGHDIPIHDLRQLNSLCQGHPDKNFLQILNASSGSLGNGLSISCGMALGLRNSRIYVLLGDGECQEGLIWESAMFASHYKLDNLCAIIDRNGLQIDGATELVMSIEPLTLKWSAFGWNVLEVDGHNISDLISAFDIANHTKNKPTVIIAHDIKGKGVPVMEWVKEWHGKVPSKEMMADII